VLFDTQTSECPTSLFVTESRGSRNAQTSLELVAYWSRVRILKESLGASPHGGDLNKFPARIVDAFVILAEEHNRVESMRYAQQPRPQQQAPTQRRTRR
jgi:hypothetical protein